MTWDELKVYIIPAIGMALMGLIKLLLSEKVLGKVVLIILRHLAKKTTNDIDDEIVVAVEDALESKD